MFAVSDLKLSVQSNRQVLMICLIVLITSHANLVLFTPYCVRTSMVYLRTFNFQNSKIGGKSML